MNRFLSLVRSNVIDLSPYESARSLTLGGSVFLDANESPISCLEHSCLNRYPEPQPRLLLERLSRIYGVSPSMLLIGRGSDEAIDLLIRAFCEPGRDRILVCPPTYGMYEICAKIQGAQVVRVPLILDSDNFYLNESGIQEAFVKNQNVKIIFLCSPNNPTGTLFNVDSVIGICELAQDKCLVVIDEAYIEFKENGSHIESLSRFSHLVILRTLSKAWAAAGARCGVAVAHSDIIQMLKKIIAPYPLSSPAIGAILEATDFDHQSLLQLRIQNTLSERERLGAALRELELVQCVYPSATNFLLVRFFNSKNVFDFLKSRGIIVRNRGGEKNLENCIRITVGSEKENQLLITSLLEVAK